MDDLIRAGSTGEFRVSDQPCSAMARHVDLGNDADSAVPSVCHNAPDIVLSVVFSVLGSKLVEFRKNFAFNAEALVIGQMPVEDVELHGFHRVEGSENDRHGHKMARHVDE